MLSQSQRIAGKVEQVGNRIIDGNEPLKLACRLEAFHGPFASPGRLVRISARLLRPLCNRCSTPGMRSRVAASKDRSLSVIMTRGVGP